jgi:hypothetical protein
VGRNPHATLALQAGIHPKAVSERRGHATITPVAIRVRVLAAPAARQVPIETPRAAQASGVFDAPRANCIVAARWTYVKGLEIGRSTWWAG